MIEYILVIVVTVVIILGLMDKMYRPLGLFIESFMGTYIGCLLETGELPHLGNTTEDEDSGECKYALPWGGGSDGEGPNAQARSNRGRSGSDSEGQEDKDTGGGGGANSIRQASVRRGSSPRRTVVGQASPLRFGSMGSDAPAGAGGGARTTVTPIEGGSRGGGYFGSSGGVRIIRQRSRYIAITGDMEAQIARAKKADEKKRPTTTRVEGGGFSRPKRAVFAPPEQTKRETAEIQGGGLDIAMIVKYVLIAGIIILLIVLIGGQLLQVSKNWEKGE